EDDDLQLHALRPGWKEFVQRRAFGRFQCSQCLHGWSSARVHILFHMCRSQGWGMVRMRTFRQTCRRCAEPRLEEPQFSEETMEKLLHNLVLKILQYFYHVPIQPSELVEVVVDVPVRGPHDSARCEGCQLGVC
ncbi:RTP3 protein, partial [Zapornia atra]|nr:RTP3 protein [Zapornia atra]